MLRYTGDRLFETFIYTHGLRLAKNHDLLVKPTNTNNNIKNDTIKNRP